MSVLLSLLLGKVTMARSGSYARLSLKEWWIMKRTLPGVLPETIICRLVLVTAILEGAAIKDGTWQSVDFLHFPLNNVALAAGGMLETP